MKSIIYLLAIVFISSSCNKQLFMRKADPIASFDWQGHRGARGLLPENTIPAFLHALTYPQIKTLELDVVVTKDEQLVVSHEPWMSAEICRFPNGELIKKPQEKEVKIMDLSLLNIQAFDCGSKQHPNFPEQQNSPAIKPGLLDVIAAAEAEALRLKRPLPYYNIEIKSNPEWDNIFTPEPKDFAQLVVQAIQEAGVVGRVTIQSFDIRSLQAVHILAPQQDLAYLVYEKANIMEQLEQLGFQPAIYSPYYKLVTARMIKKLHQLGIKIIPWTVNDTHKMESLQSMGVDGIITDYPNRIPTLKRD